MPKMNSIGELNAYRGQLRNSAFPEKTCIAICCDTGCEACGSNYLVEAFNREIERNGLGGAVEVRQTGCLGYCERGIVVVMLPDDICYLSVKPSDVPDIVSETIMGGRLVDRLLYQDEDGNRIARQDEIPFYKRQMRLVFGSNKHMNPRSIDDYIALGGYSALAKALGEMTPELVLAEVKEANLRGRGGGGFPAGVKWETTRNAPGEIKYVIVNADEGDPGAYMDRSLLEGNPHSVLEGLIIGAYAIGAHRGYVYVRQEYPAALESIQVALKHAREYGLLGQNILGSGFDFDVVIHRGAGSFVSGESSALMTAIEGKVGRPRPKYIRTSVSGLWDRPTNLNNVETWATVPLVINRGAGWFKTIGTEGSKGTKIFSLVGKVKNTGLVEVPMGTTLREVIFDIGGGVPGGKAFKGVQTGGPSGGVLPVSLLDLPVDFDALSEAGSMMGSGGMIVMDETNCAVNTARYFLEFLVGESCGKCTPCREGVAQMLAILNRICEGDGLPGDIERLQDISAVVKEASLCALGQSAPNPVLSTIRYFRGEYEAHIYEKQCPAGACKSLIEYYIDPEKCKACMICLRNCPAGAISGGKGQVHTIDQTKCTKCNTCLDVCPSRFGAVTKRSKTAVLV
ncbi:MAG: 4Fe-4S binding protein [Chloroflexi bacterium]|nr:4Fe-4S binding protein [Chloroflexota bacterium]